jgi:hypothetical protein
MPNRVVWSDEALARGGLDRARAEEMLRLAHELVDLPDKVLPGPAAGEEPVEWAERVILGAPKVSETKVVHSQLHVDRLHNLWRQMFRDER